MAAAAAADVAVLHPTSQPVEPKHEHQHGHKSFDGGCEFVRAPSICLFDHPTTVLLLSLRCRLHHLQNQPQVSLVELEGKRLKLYRNDCDDKQGPKSPSGLTKGADLVQL